MEDKPAAGNVRSRLPLRKKLLFAGVMLCVALLATEIGLRLAGWETMNVDPDKPNIQEYFWISDERLGFRNRPDGDYVYEWIAARPHVTTDSLGYRNGGGWQAAGDGPIVAFVGDSTTFCAEVNDDETGAAETAKLLKSHEVAIRPLNAGCRGYNTLQALRSLQECLDRFPDVKVAVYSYCDNDYFENLNPGVYAPASAPTAWMDQPGGEPVQIEPDSHGKPWGAGLAGPRPPRGWRRQATDFLRAHSVVVNHALFGVRALVGQESAGGPRQVLSNGSVVGTYGTDRQQQVAWAKANGADLVLEHLLRAMHALCEARGVKLLATEISTETFSPHWFAERCDAGGVQFVDLAPQFPGDPQQYQSKKIDRQFDPHFGPVGTRAFAAGLAPVVKELLASEAEEGRAEP